jgi:hypothetical protein
MSFQIEKRGQCTRGDGVSVILHAEARGQAIPDQGDINWEMGIALSHGVSLNLRAPTDRIDDVFSSLRRH